mgnify:FL=1
MNLRRWISAAIACAALAAACTVPSARAAGSAADTVSAASFAGDWHGQLNAGFSKLQLVVHFKRQPDGGLSATFDSPDQSAFGLPVDSVFQQGRALRFVMNAIRGSFEGALDASGDTLAGSWTQGMSLPLAFTRGPAPAIRRPQDPVRPFPYDEEEVVVENAAAAVRLAGTLTKPRGPGPFPAALLITGSGPQNRDEELADHRPFLVLADHLTRHGLAVLRLDDRGVGRSTGTFAGATTRDFAGDARAAVEFLKRRGEVDRARIGLIGHSEGGIIAPMLAADSKDIAFVVLMAGPGLPGEWILVRQGELLNRAAGASESLVALNRAAQESTFAIVKAEQDTAAAARRIRALAGRLFAHVGGDQKQAGSAMQRQLEQQAGFVASAWFRFFLTYDPAPTLRKVKCPVLALNGSKDLQVPPAEDLAAIAGALEAGGNRDFKTVELPNLNHLFQTSATGSVAEYGTIEETIAPAALDTMTAWIEARVKK